MCLQLCWILWLHWKIRIRLHWSGGKEMWNEGTAKRALAKHMWIRDGESHILALIRNGSRVDNVSYFKTLRKETKMHSLSPIHGGSRKDNPD